MHSVEHVHGWWVLRACRRDPPVRGSDRLELLIIALGIVVAMVAAACAAALGTAVNDARSRVYIAQAQTRHTVTARATEDSTIVSGSRRQHGDQGERPMASQRHRTHRQPQLGSRRQTGDPLTIWVDRDGDRVDAPAPTSQAGADAVGVAIRHRG